MIINDLKLKKFLNSRYLRGFSLLCWFVALFSYYFQFPFQKIAVLIVPSLVVYCFININSFVKNLNNKKMQKVWFFYIVFLLIEISYSLFLGNNLVRILRFVFILLMIPYGAMIVDKFNDEKKIFILLSVCKSIILICIAIYLVAKGNHHDIRIWAQTNNLGDIYLGVLNLPKVQVRGNALLLFSFIYYYVETKKIDIKLIILFLGVLSAGNFAFILTMFGFCMMYLLKYMYQLVKEKKINIYLIAFVILIILAIMIPYISTILQSKAGDSNSIKLEQAQILLKGNLFFGNGLGNFISETTSSRIYNGDLYFELQWLYIINQIGIVGFGIFSILMGIILLKNNNYTAIFVYLMYIIYSSVNPYCFDTTNIIVIIMAVNILKGEHRYGRCINNNI